MKFARHLVVIVLLLASVSGSVFAETVFSTDPGFHPGGWYNARPTRSRATTPRTEAQPKETPILLSPQEIAAKATLDRMGAALNHAESLKYSAIVQYPSGSPTAVKMNSVVATATLERPARMKVDASVNGVTTGSIYASGATLALYDFSLNGYTTVQTSPDLWSLQKALELAGKAVYPKQTQSGQALKYTLDFPMMFFSKSYDLSKVPQGYTLTYSSLSSTSADSKPDVQTTITLTSVRAGTVTATYTIDPATNLPEAFVQTETLPGRSPIVDLQMNFTSIKTVKRSESLAVFSFTPPPGSSLISAGL